MVNVAKRDPQPFVCLWAATLACLQTAAVAGVFVTQRSILMGQ
jgi:hypothetical protein